MEKISLKLKMTAAESYKIVTNFIDFANHISQAVIRVVHRKCLSITGF